MTNPSVLLELAGKNHGVAANAAGLSSATPTEPVPVSSVSVSIPNADSSNWSRKTVAVWEVYYCGEYVAYKVNFYGDWHLNNRNGRVFSAHSLQEVMEHASELAKQAASAIEARRAETQSGSVHESATAESRDAQPSPASTPTPESI